MWVCDLDAELVADEAGPAREVGSALDGYVEWVADGLVESNDVAWLEAQELEDGYLGACELGGDPHGRGADGAAHGVEGHGLGRAALEGGAEVGVVAGQELLDEGQRQAEAQVADARVAADGEDDLEDDLAAAEDLCGLGAHLERIGRKLHGRDGAPSAGDPREEGLERAADDGLLDGGQRPGLLERLAAAAEQPLDDAEGQGDVEAEQPTMLAPLRRALGVVRVAHAGAQGLDADRGGQGGVEGAEGDGLDGDETDLDGRAERVAEDAREGDGRGVVELLERAELLARQRTRLAEVEGLDAALPGALVGGRRGGIAPAHGLEQVAEFVSAQELVHSQGSYWMMNCVK